MEGKQVRNGGKEQQQALDRDARGDGGTQIESLCGVKDTGLQWSKL